MSKQLRPIQEISLGSIGDKLKALASAGGAKLSAGKDAVVGYGKGLADDMVNFGRNAKAAGSNFGGAVRDAMNLQNAAANEKIALFNKHAKEALGNLKGPGKFLGGSAALGGTGYGAYELMKNREDIAEKLGGAVDEARYKLDSDYRDQVDAVIDQANWDSTSTLDKLSSDPSRLAGDAWQWMKDNPEYSLPGAGAAALAAGAGAVALRKKLRSTQ